MGFRNLASENSTQGSVPTLSTLADTVEPAGRHACASGSHGPQSGAPTSHCACQKCASLRVNPGHLSPPAPPDEPERQSSQQQQHPQR